LYFVGSDDKVKPERPFLLYPPDFGRPYECIKKVYIEESSFDYPEMYI
jgi:hypothetical protein